MPFTNTPTVDTYSSHRIPLVQPQFSAQANGTFYGMTNLLPFKSDEGEFYSQTRYGITAYSAVGSVGSTVCRGLHVWEKSVGTTYYFIVVGQSVYTATAITGPYTAVTTFATNVTTPVRFTEFVDSTNTKSLIAVDGTEGYIFTSNAAGTKITDADFPSPHVPFPVFMDGFLFLAKAGTGDIYNSDLNTPSAWTAGSYISSEIYPDNIQALVKVNNYILAIGTQGCEFFYDAANPTASPLARYEGTVIPFGTPIPNSVAYTDDTVCFVGRHPSGDYSLRVIEGFKFSEVPAAPIISALTLSQGSATANSAVRAYFFKQYGNLYYGIAQDGTTNSDTTGVANWHYVVDFATKSISKFTRGVDTTRTTYGSNGHKTYPVYFSSGNRTYDGGTVVAGLAYNVAFIGILDYSATGVDTLPLNSTSLSSTWYLSSIYTNAKDFGTMNRKFMSRVGVNYSVRLDASATNSDGSLLPRLSWIDSASDLVNGTNTQGGIPLAGGYYQSLTNNNYGIYFPFIYQLGTFRERYFLLETYGGALLNYLEADINKGNR